MFKNCISLAFMEEKATVPIGGLNDALSKCVLRHNKSLGGCIASFNYDWKLGGLVPSVSLIYDTTESIKHSFFLKSSV